LIITFLNHYYLFLSMKGEPFLISLLRQRARAEADAHASNTASRFRLHLSSLRLGIGDDAAIIARADNAGETVLTADLLVENVDFRRNWMPPELLGHKALAVSLSDVAAMGAAPRYALVSLGVPQEVWASGFAEKFYDGWFALARRYGVALIGGDLSRTPEHIVVDSIVVGETAPPQKAIRREGARPGDLLYVTGKLGGAAAGLRLLESGAGFSADNELMRRQLAPEPRVEIGLWLNESRQQAAGSEQPGRVTAMLDLSDGLSTDLARLCEASGVGAIVEEERLPLASTLDDALNGGEDFELLFTAPPEVEIALPDELAHIGITRIGRITGDANRIYLQNNVKLTELTPAGFDHFQENS
jgi:thiamine-monophosphate kinase